MVSERKINKRKTGKIFNISEIIREAGLTRSDQTLLANSLIYDQHVPDHISGKVLEVLEKEVELFLKALKK